MISIVVMAALMLVITAVLLAAERFLVPYGECSVTINGRRTFTVRGGDSLPEALNQNGIFIPSGCGGKATCGLCRIKVLSGAGGILPTEEVHLTRREAEDEVRLACQVKVRDNLDLLVPEDLLTAERFESLVADISPLTHDTRLVTLDLCDSRTINFRPGQYVQIKIPGTDEYRAYSIATPPSMNNKIQLIVRLVPGGLCSTYVHKALAEDDRVVFTGPFGEFCLRENNGTPIVAIGGGCDMTPIRSIVHHLAEKGMPRSLSYFFGARTETDLFYTEELKAFERRFSNFKYIPALSDPTPGNGWRGEVGLVTEVVRKHMDKGGRDAYLCGPPAMIEAAIDVLTEKGTDPSGIYYDKF